MAYKRRKRGGKARGGAFSRTVESHKFGDIKTQIRGHAGVKHKPRGII